LLQAATSAPHGSPSHYCFHPLDGGRCQVLEWLLFFFAAGGRQGAAMDFPLDPVSRCALFCCCFSGRVVCELCIESKRKKFRYLLPAFPSYMVRARLRRHWRGPAWAMLQADWVAWMDLTPEPAASAESTEHGNPQPGWTNRYAQFVNSVVVFVCSNERVG
jgi:hypothetical protein